MYLEAFCHGYRMVYIQVSTRMVIFGLRNEYTCSNVRYCYGAHSSEIKSQFFQRKVFQNLVELIKLKFKVE